MHWSRKVIKLTTFSSLDVPEVVIMITYCAAMDGKVVNMTTTFLFQWASAWLVILIEAEAKWLPFCRFQINFIVLKKVVSDPNVTEICSQIPINKGSALVPIMVWYQTGDKPLSEQGWPHVLTHKCITRPCSVNSLWPRDTIWRQRSGSPRHYLIISEVQWDSY